MNPGFKINWDFAEKYMPAIVEILKDNAKYIVDVEVATPDEDMHQSTDLKIKVSGGDVAVRVRRGNIKFRDMTLRAHNKGHKTELDKLRDGFAKWYLYAWENEQQCICDWILVDIDAMRKADLLSENRKIIMNKDGVTGFVTYKIDELERCNALMARY